MDKKNPKASELNEIRQKAGEGKRIVFVSGNFNIIHPGHLRLLKFASDCGDFLVVGVTKDTSRSLSISAEMRLEGVRAIGLVGHAFLMEEAPEEFIARLQPAVVIKGKEYENRVNPEREIVEAYGGTLLFSSGEVRFSSIDLMRRELLETNFSSIRKPKNFSERHGFTFADLIEVVKKFSGLNVVVLGDLVIDEYINCDALGMSQEDPTIVVTPIHNDKFVGGAGIVAAHAQSLGAKVRYLCVTGNDAISAYAKEMLTQLGVESTFILDHSRPTTLKQRYRVSGKTLLRVSHLRQHDISLELIESMFSAVVDALAGCNLLVFSDFNYGCLPQGLVDRITAYCHEKKIIMVADSQTSSQLGDVSRYKGMHLLTPTEYEARVSMRDNSSGLVVLADALRRKAQAKQIFVTLGSEGLLIHAPAGNSGEFRTDQLPAFNSTPKDVSGAGDSLLICASMALALGTDVWQAAYLGCIGAACQVGRVGNLPLTAEELITELSL
jgi:rfaE bifunctional protein kinase chain/domain